MWLLRYLQAVVRNYFGFSQKETNAALFIILLMLLLAVFPLLFNWWWQNDWSGVQQKDQRRLDSLLATLQTQADSVAALEKNNLVAVNLNEADSMQLLQAGFPSWIIKRIISYRHKVRPFAVKSDLLQVYGMTPQLYEKVAPYVLLPDSLPPDDASPHLAHRKEKTTKPTQYTLPSFDINTADTTQLQALKGIGSKLALRIIKYRNQLGGFVNEKQFQEIYGLSDVAIEQLEKVAYIAPDFKPLRLNPNQATFQQLNQHPYVSYEATKRILQHTKKQKITTWEELELLLGSPTAPYWKHYFTLENENKAQPSVSP